MADRPKLTSELAKSRVTRIQRMGVNGLQASAMGLVLLACIAGGYFAGAWLDKKYGVSYWTPGLTFIGMAAGFVETFRTLKSLTASSKWPTARPRPDLSGESEELEEAPERISIGGVLSSKTSTVAKPEKNLERQPPARLFSVPPPPLPEFEQRKSDSRDSAESKPNSARSDAGPDDTTELLEKLLHDEDSRRHE